MAFEKHRQSANLYHGALPLVSLESC